MHRRAARMNDNSDLVSFDNFLRRGPIDTSHILVPATQLVTVLDTRRDVAHRAGDWRVTWASNSVRYSFNWYWTHASQARGCG